MGYAKARKLLKGLRMGTTTAHSLAFMGTLLTTSCVIPIPASPEEDAGAAAVPSTPFVYTSNPQMPGPITIVIDSFFPVSVTLRDANLEDTLYVRVFRDYSKNPERGPLVDKMVPNDPIRGKPDREDTVDTTTWCNGAPLNEQVLFTLVVADKPFEKSAAIEPPYQAITANGLSSKSSWVGRCVAAP